MPIYEYVCNNCNKVFEIMFVPIADKPVEKCSNCESLEVTRVISSSHFRLNKDALATVPDPTLPLQRQKAMGEKKGYKGGYEDLPETDMSKMIMEKDDNGNNIWREKERTTFSG
jgi:putative FmdB family regulatory protein